MDDKCSFFLWDTDAEAREKVQFGEALAGRAPTTTVAEPETPAAAPTAAPAPRVRPPGGFAAPITRNVPPPSKQFPKVYPPLAADDDGFDYLDTPTKRPVRRKSNDPYDDDFDWEESDEDVHRRKPVQELPPAKRARFDVPDSMPDFEFSPPASPAVRTKAPKTLADPFVTPPRQIMATPHTPPDTRPLKSNSPPNLTPLSYSLLHQLEPHQKSLGSDLFADLKNHLLKCGRVADGAVKGRDAARAVAGEKDKRIGELEKRVMILESEREVDRAVIGALKRNVDVLTGKVKRTD
jgi:hypothetical protein